MIMSMIVLSTVWTIYLALSSRGRCKSGCMPSEQHTIQHFPAHAVCAKATDLCLDYTARLCHPGLQSADRLTCMPYWFLRQSTHGRMSVDVQAPVGCVAVAVSLSNVSRATVTPQQLLFTPDNWSVAQLVRTAPAALHSLLPCIIPLMHVYLFVL